MDELVSILEAECPKFKLELTAEQRSLFLEYAKFLVEYNGRVNLTAILEPRGIAIKHFLDSMLLYKALESAGFSAAGGGLTLADIGSGAGFPGVPVKILEPNVELTLIDSLNKRVAFLTALGERLGIKVTAVHMRAEEAGRSKGYREGFSVVSARAVAALPLLSEYCLPLVAVGGVFAAMKAKGALSEAREAKEALRLLGGELLGIEEFLLPDGEERAIVLIKKISHTPTKYPRPSAKIAKSPL